MQMTLECLREALAGKLGCVLTPEIAAEIEHRAHDRADRALSPGLFLPRPYRNLTFRVESFRAILPELEALHAAHFAETETHLPGSAMNPDYGYMGERERRGELVQFTARDEAWNLVGNLRMYLSSSLHTGNRFASEDTFYLSPVARKGFCAMAFLQYAEEMLAMVAGVKEFRASTKTVNTAGKLLDRRGYNHVANQYIKIVKE
jgi:hypothetical protein